MGRGPGASVKPYPMVASDERLSKLYYRIGEVAAIVGVDPSVLRHWEHEFRALRPRRTKSGQRVYSQQDVRKLLEIRRLRYEEQLTTKGAIRRLQQVGIEPRPDPEPAAPEPAATSPEEPAAAAVPQAQLRAVLLDLRKRVVDLILLLDGEEAR